jgi:hypothetical protein
MTMWARATTADTTKNRCDMCGERETTTHIMITCDAYKQARSRLKMNTPYMKWETRHTLTIMKRLLDCTEGTETNSETKNTDRNVKVFLGEVRRIRRKHGATPLTARADTQEQELGQEEKEAHEHDEQDSFYDKETQKHLKHELEGIKTRIKHEGLSETLIKQIQTAITRAEERTNI